LYHFDRVTPVYPCLGEAELPSIDTIKVEGKLLTPCL
jgi:hypothetical protein